MKRDAKKVLVVGGYGDVGKHVVAELLSATTTQVVVAGRDGGKAQRFVEELDDTRLSSIRIDIYDRSSWGDATDDVALVVMCLSPRDTDFAKHCLREGVHYIDISPSGQVADELMDLHGECGERGVTGVLGVGVCPGVSTLLASDLATGFDHVEKMDVSLMLGMGDEYGSDSIKWLLANLRSPFTWTKGAASATRQPFEGRARAEFSPPLGTRSAYAFNLADQQILSSAVAGSDVSTYFCYDLRFFTWLVRLMAALKIFKLLKFSVANRIITGAVGLSIKLAKPFSSDGFAINVKIQGHKNGAPASETADFTGSNSALATAKVVAQTASKLIDGAPEPGVFYLNQLFQLKDFNV
jgi:saccharopine dehydrogenase-like NADP-dependent oxidoreductase